MAVTCAFAAFLNEALRDRLVCGIADIKSRKRLLVERDLTLEKAIEITTSLEGVEIETRLMSSMSSRVPVKSEETEILQFNSKDKRKCYRCASEYHLANRCKFKNSKCNNCGLTGHIAVACRNKSRKTENLQIQTHDGHDGKFENNPGKTAFNSDEENEILYLQKLYGANRPYVITLDIYMERLLSSRSIQVLD